MSVADSEITDNVAGLVATGPGSVTGGGIQRFAIDGAPQDSIVRTTIADNSATGVGASGGGLSAATQGSLVIARTTISGNSVTGASTGTGGGARLGPGTVPGVFSIVNSTVHDNHALGPAGGFAGGILLNAGSDASPPSSLVHSTITANEAAVGSTGGEAGNLYVTAGRAELRGTIIAAGIGAPAESNCNVFQPASYVSLGENVEDTSPSQCGFSGSDQVGVNPLLGPLALNGLPADLPLTRALLAGSPAIDSVPPGGSCPTTDQRGVPRPQGAACDAGAFELDVAQPPPPPSQPLSPPAASKKKKCKKGQKRVKGKCKKPKKKKK